MSTTEWISIGRMTPMVTPCEWLPLIMGCDMTKPMEQERERSRFSLMLRG